MYSHHVHGTPVSRPFQHRVGVAIDAGSRYMSDFCAAATEFPNSNGYRKSIIGNATLSPPSFSLYILLNSVDSSLNY